jgi:hypothetical protein
MNLSHSDSNIYCIRTRFRMLCIATALATIGNFAGATLEYPLKWISVLTFAGFWGLFEFLWLTRACMEYLEIKKRIRFYHYIAWSLASWPAMVFVLVPGFVLLALGSDVLVRHSSDRLTELPGWISQSFAFALFVLAVKQKPVSNSSVREGSVVATVIALFEIIVAAEEHWDQSLYAAPLMATSWITGMSLAIEEGAEVENRQLRK